MAVLWSVKRWSHVFHATSAGLHIFCTQSGVESSGVVAANACLEHEKRAGQSGDKGPFPSLRKRSIGLIADLLHFACHSTVYPPAANPGHW